MKLLAVALLCTVKTFTCVVTEDIPDDAGVNDGSALDAPIPEASAPDALPVDAPAPDAPIIMPDAAPSPIDAAPIVPLNILPFGDSYTSGYPLYLGGYRAPLITLTTRPINWIGSLSDVVGRYEGHLGANTNQLFTGMCPCTANRWTLNYTATPEVVLLMAGTNDVYYPYQSVPNALLGLDSLVLLMGELYPNAKIFVSSIPNLPGNPNGVLQYNAGIPGVVAKNVMRGYHVYFVDGNSYLLPSDTGSDNVHLTSIGNGHLAQAWYDALHAQGIF